MTQYDLVVISLELPRKEAHDFTNKFAEWIIANYPEWNDDPSPVNLEISETEMKGR